MTTGEMVQKSAYMYKMINGQFKCFEGYIVRYPQRRDIFYVRNLKKYYTVSEQPNEIHCGNLWMLERDDATARRVFCKYYWDSITDLTIEIVRLYGLMKIVEEEL